MTYATILVALILALCVARIVFLNKEIRELEVGTSDFLKVVENWQTSSLKGGVAVSHEMPKEVQEAQIEYEWASNARDSKKESRTIWLGGALVSLVALIAAVVELSTNSF